MSQAVADRVRLSGFATIAINTTARLAPWASMLYAADSFWIVKHEKEMANFDGLKVTCSAENHHGWLALRNTGKAGFDNDTGSVRTGGNSGYQALHLAVHAHAGRVLLCGFDMRSVGHEVHWHGRHPEPLRNAGDGIFTRWIKHFEDIAEIAHVRGVQILNCTPGSALHAFPFMNLEDALETPSRSDPDEGRIALSSRSVSPRTEPVGV